MTAYPQVGQNAIHFVYAMKSKETLQVAEIIRDENKSFIVQAVPFCVCVLVKSKQAAICIQVSEDLC
jgi:hypothetical protein